MKRKMFKIVGVATSLAIVLALVVGIAVPVAAAPDEEAWSVFNIPVVGAPGDYFMDPAITSLGPLAKATDDTLYLYAANYNELFTSTVAPGQQPAYTPTFLLPHPSRI